MNDIVLGFVIIIGFIICIYVSCTFPEAFLKEFSKSCDEAIKKRDKELEEKEKTYIELRKWLFTK